MAHLVLRVLHLMFYPLIFVCSWIFHKLLEPIITKCYQSKILFNCAWEDPRLDLEALQLSEGRDKVLVITSAGCNVLALALHGAKHVYSIDLNPCQNALLELKIAAIREFSYDQFWQLFGRGRMDRFSRLYYPVLRQHLSLSARKFWDEHAHYFDGKGWRNSFYFRGCSGFLAWLVRGYLHLFPGLWPAMLELLECQTIEEQKRVYHEKVEKKMWNPVLMWLLGSRAVLALLNGVPDAQRQLLEKEGGHATVGLFIKNSLEVVMTQLPLKDNYFYRVYLTGEYAKECCPDYLTKEGFAKLKAGSVNNISIHTETIEEFLSTYPEKDITRFILLDHMDWMSADHESLGKEWQQILDHAAEDAKFLWRSASETAEFVGETQVKYEGREARVKDLVTYDMSLAKKLHALDRVHTYASFFVTTLAS